MANRIDFRSGNTSIAFNDEISDMANQLVNKLMPDTKREIEQQLEQIKNDAASRWLVREEKSKNSKSKLYTEISISSNFELIGVVGNKAPYAWAIKVGGDQQNTGLNTGARLADGLLWKPVKKKANTLANVIANETMKTLKK